MFRKNVLKSLTMFVFVLCIFIGSSINVHAYVGEWLREPAEGWIRHPLGKSDLVKYTGSWDIYSSELHISGDIKKDVYGNEIFVGFDPNSKIEFTFTGTAIRVLSSKDGWQGAKYKITIDDDVDEMFHVSTVDPIDQNEVLFEKMHMDNKKHKVTIIPIEYTGERYPYRPKYNYKLAAIDIDGELAPNYNNGSGTVNEDENVVLDVEPQKEKIKIDEEVVADLTINNINEIAAEDIRIKYDSSKLEYLGYEEVEGIKLIKDIQNNDEIRVILASQGEANIINAKEVLLRLKFRGIASGEAIVDVKKGRVTDGIEMEKDLEDSECGKGIILIEEQEGFIDVNNSGEFTLLDLGIDARHLNKDPNAVELSEYNTDIIEDGSINDMDLLEIGKLMLENGNYTPNNY
ncbi:cohesin domain-containing protein [Peptostreptococcaceae bacterium AGR-M142]